MVFMFIMALKRLSLRLLIDVTQRFLNAPKGKKNTIAPRLNTTRQVESHYIMTKTGLVRHISY